MINLKSQAHEFVHKLLGELSVAQYWDIDHICYRVATSERYAELKAEFANTAKLLAETEVNGRPIATFQFHEALVELEDGRFIDILELPAPKPGRTYAEGFEHIEMVPNISLSELQRQLHARGVDTSLNEKDFNPELTVQIKNIGAIKFHPLSLKSVVTLESNAKVWAAIQQSQVLQVLKKYTPQVAGTFPLALEVPGSDVDVICNYSDQMEFIEVVKKHFGGYKFHVGNVSFEIYGQPLNTKQRAIEHFLVEERLLKYGGERLHEQIRNLRTQGYKTEPAFAKLLNLTDDPYEAIASMATSVTSELRTLLKAVRY